MRFIIAILLWLGSPYDCAAIDAEYAANGWQLVPFEWTADYYGWVGLPDDLGRPKVRKGSDGRKRWTYTSKGSGRVFELYWFNYEVSTAPDGSKAGSHNFCGLYEKVT